MFTWMMIRMTTRSKRRVAQIWDSTSKSVFELAGISRSSPIRMFAPLHFLFFNCRCLMLWFCLDGVFRGATSIRQRFGHLTVKTVFAFCSGGSFQSRCLLQKKRDAQEPLTRMVWHTPMKNSLSTTRVPGRRIHQGFEGQQVRKLRSVFRRWRFSPADKSRPKSSFQVLSASSCPSHLHELDSCNTNS